MKVSCSIMAHPDRTGYVEELRKSLGDVPVSWDEEGPANNDTEKRWRNGVRAWRMADPDAVWHVVVQDDALVAPDFLPGLERAVEHVPTKAVVSAYAGTKRPANARWEEMARRADRTRASWIVTPSLAWGVAIVLPVNTIEDMVTWSSRRYGHPYDLRIAKHYARLSFPAYFTWPSLVDHRDGPSLVRHGVQGRNARKMVDGSSLSVNWAGPVVYDLRMRSRHGGRNGPGRGNHHLQQNRRSYQDR